VTDRTLGLVVNPIAGMGGPIGLKGTDGWSRVELERLGAIATSANRATQAMVQLERARPDEILCGAGPMGADAVNLAGLRPTIVHEPTDEETTSDDTVVVARAMVAAGCGLILFAGGDGTARDVHRAVGTRVPTLGIPAGVKIHSAAFAINPTVAGELAAAVLAGEVTSTREAEVVDLDEAAYRAGRISVRLFGYLRVPDRPESIQGSKVRSTGDEEAIASIGRAIAERMEPGVRYVVGPGTTAKAVLRAINLPFTLLGVDLVLDGDVIGTDLTAADILLRTDDAPTRLIVSPIGGQGHVFGRGNQQLSPQLIRRVGKVGLIVAASPRKLASMRGRPLFVDTGDAELDAELAGFVRVITGRDRETVYALAC
jgi:predicted polyphosphate/ATP-dependent NAD kinase